MNPPWFNRIEPGAFERQQMGDQARFTRRFGGLIVQTDPRPQALTLMPTGIIPNDDHHPFALLASYRQQRDDEHPGLFTVGLTGTEEQARLVDVLPHRTKAGQRFFGFMMARFPPYQSKGFTGQRPGG